MVKSSCSEIAPFQCFSRANLSSRFPPIRGNPSVEVALVILIIVWESDYDCCDCNIVSKEGEELNLVATRSRNRRRVRISLSQLIGERSSRHWLVNFSAAQPVLGTKQIQINFRTFVGVSTYL
mmetsp:Transcript_8346/g.12495  ORF Transcript_8346/g.12495 Transcript_8346/m.12495 type:complete len:123 (-) Transcript_8346:178-546(-)